MYPKKGKKWYLIVTFLATAFAIVIFALWTYLPLFVQNHILPSLVSETGLDPQQLRIRRLGVSGADIGPIRLGLGDDRFLTIPAIQIDYSPAVIFDRKIDRIVLSGIKLDLHLNDQGTAIIGLPSKPEASDKDGQALTFEELSKKIPVGLSLVELQNCLVMLHWRGHMVAIPVDLALDLSGMAKGKVKGDGQLLPRGNLIGVNFALNSKTNNAAVSISSDTFSADAFSDVLTEIFNSPVSVELGIQMDTEFSIHPLSLMSMSLSAGFNEVHIAAPKINMSPLSQKRQSERAIQLSLKRDDKSHWQWALTPFQLDYPVKYQIFKLEGLFVNQVHNWNMSASFSTRFDQLPVAKVRSLSAQLNRPVSVDWRLSAQGTEDEKVQIKVASNTDDDSIEQLFEVGYGEWALKGQVPQAKLEGIFANGAFKAQYEIDTKGFRADSSDLKIKCPDINVKGQLVADQKWLVDGQVAVSALRIVKNDSFSVHLPKIMVNTQFENGEDQKWALQGKLQLSKGTLQDTTYSVSAHHVKVALPFQWPLEAQRPLGKLKVGQIKWRNKSLASIEGDLGLKPDLIWAKLRGRSELFPGLRVNIDTDMSTSGMKISVKVPEYHPQSTIDLSDIADQADGYMISGRFKGNAQFELNEKGRTGFGRIVLNDGVLRHAESQTVIEGIAFDLTLKDLISLQSAPQQQLHVDALTLGKIIAKNFDVDFQIESGSVLFVEKATLRWCHGLVQAHALRLKPGLEKLETTLFCDRLNLAMLLEQLSSAKGSGNGTVNGRIPIRFNNGKLSFDNGFLLSTPGQTGKIQLSGTQVLLDGFPPGSPQHLQLDIATEALKDYSYNWAKLKLESRGRNLLASLELDGKPNRLMPFGFDPQTGSLKRVKGRAEADFKGIGIDLNFRTPLEDILHYKGLLTPNKP